MCADFAFATCEAEGWCSQEATTRNFREFYLASAMSLLGGLKQVVMPHLHFTLQKRSGVLTYLAGGVARISEINAIRLWTRLQRFL